MRKAALSTVYYISNQNTTTTQNTSTPTTLTTLSSILQNEVAHIDALQSGSTSHVESAYSSTSLSLTSDSHYYTKPEPQIHAGIYIYGFCLVLIPTATILGNLLVIVSVLRFKALHSAINFLILGLAVADLLVALFVMPYAVYVYVQGGYWFLGALMCDIYSASDVSCSTASILLLAVISFDRYRAVSRPIQYSRQSQNIKRVVIIILVIWVISFAIASPIVLGVNYRPIDANPYECRFYNPLFSIFSSLLSFVIPCIIVLFVYIRIMMALREREKAARIRRFASQQIESGKDRSMQEREESEEAGELVAGPVVNCMMFALPSMNKRIKRFERHKRAIEHAGSDSLNGSQENLELDEEGDEGDDEVGFDIEEDFDEEDIALPKRRNSKCRKKLKMSERCKPWKATTQIAGALSSLVAGARNTSLNTLSFPDGQVPSDLSKHKKKRFIEAESLSTENNWRIFDRQSTSINRTNKLFFPKLEKADFSSELEEDLPKLKPTIPQIIEECYVIGDEALKTRARSCSCLLPVLSPSLNYPNSNQSIAAVSSTNTLRSNMKDKKYIIGLNAFNYYLPTASSHSEIYHIFSLSCPYLFECACFHNSLTSSDPFFKNNNQPLHNQPYYYYATNEANWLKPNKAKQNLQYSYSAPASLNEEPKLIFSNFKPNKVPTYSFELTKYDQMSDKRQPNSAPTSNRSFKKRQESNKQAKQKFFGFGLSDEVNQEHVSENGFKNINSFVGSQEESLDENDLGVSSTPRSSLDSLSDTLHVMTNDFVSEGPTPTSRKSSEHEVSQENKSVFSRNSISKNSKHQDGHANRFSRLKRSLRKKTRKSFAQSPTVVPDEAVWTSIPAEDIFPAIFRQFSRRRFFRTSILSMNEEQTVVQQPQTRLREIREFKPIKKKQLASLRRKSDSAATVLKKRSLRTRKSFFIPTDKNNEFSSTETENDTTLSTTPNPPSSTYVSEKIPSNTLAATTTLTMAAVTSVSPLGFGDKTHSVENNKKNAKSTTLAPCAPQEKEIKAGGRNRKAGYSRSDTNPTLSVNATECTALLNEAAHKTYASAKLDLVIKNIGAKGFMKNKSPSVTFQLSAKELCSLRRGSSAIDLPSECRSKSMASTSNIPLESSTVYSENSPLPKNSQNSMEPISYSSQSQHRQSNASSKQLESKRRLLSNSKLNGSTTALAVRIVKKTINRKESSLKRKVNKSQRKEKRATKTLGIVVGTFLICWVPFFSINIINAICVQFKQPSCEVGFGPFFYSTWIGYMNSFMNPVIYTIFNTEFRRAFKSLIMGRHSARRGNNRARRM